jgi:hypothetical protein
MALPMPRSRQAARASSEKRKRHQVARSVHFRLLQRLFGQPWGWSELADRPTHRAFNGMRQQLCRTLALAGGGLAEGHGAGQRQRLDLDRRAFRFVGGACALQEPLREGQLTTWVDFAFNIDPEDRSTRCRPNWPLSARPDTKAGRHCCAPTRSARPAWPAPNTRVRGARLRAAVLAALASAAIVHAGTSWPRTASGPLRSGQGLQTVVIPGPSTTPSPTAWPRSWPAQGRQDRRVHRRAVRQRR